MENDTRLRARVMHVLRASSVFGTLDDAVIQDLADVLSLQTVRGGDVVVHEGDVSSSMLFVISGALRVSRRDDSGQLLLFNEVRPGASFGEAGLILQQPRAADVSALRDSTLAVLHRQDYEALLTRHPLPLNRVLVQAVYNYLRHNIKTPHQHAESIAVVPLTHDADGFEVAKGLADAFAKMGPTHHLSLAENDDFAHAKEGQNSEEISRQEMLEGEFEYLVYEAGGGFLCLGATCVQAGRSNRFCGFRWLSPRHRLAGASVDEGARVFD